MEEKDISITEARKQFCKLIQDVRWNNTTYVIRDRHGCDAAIICQPGHKQLRHSNTAEVKMRKVTSDILKILGPYMPKVIPPPHELTRDSCLYDYGPDDF